MFAVSIHAPTWGATFGPHLPYHHNTCFNPRSHVGSDLREALHDAADREFQSTLPRGERPDGLVPSTLNCCVSIHAPTWGATFQQTFKFISVCFNPRSHVGSDGGARRGLVQANVSIHAPTWGATTCDGEQHIVLRVSIHAPTWGAT